MLDIRIFREDPSLIRAELEKRQDKEKLAWVDEIILDDTIARKIKAEVDELRSRRNTLSQDINKLRKEGKDASQVIKEAQQLPAALNKKEEELMQVRKRIKEKLMRLPNLTHESVPYGPDESGNVTVRTFADKPQFSFNPLGHADLLEQHPEWADLERAAKISGARWYFLQGDLALLEMAITRYAVDFMRKRGYTLVVPPHMMNRKAYEGVTSLDDFQDALYKIDGEDLYMIATSEHPLTARYMGEVLQAEELPIRSLGFSTNFRKEAGSHGKDTKGIFRVHQFNKVEQIIISKPEESWELHEELLQNAQDFFESLGLHCRIVNICTGDLGIVAAKKYDIEAWFPSQGTYREVVSCSNCTSYQSVRLGIRYQHKEGRAHAHTLNSTCVATSRAVCAIIENFQNEDGSVTLPEVLRPYMDGMERIGKK